MNGLHMHGVVGKTHIRYLGNHTSPTWKSRQWDQEAIYNIILAGGTEPIVHIDAKKKSWKSHPKVP